MFPSLFPPAATHPGGGWSIDWATERPQTAVEQTEPAKQEDPQTEPSEQPEPNPPQEEEQQPTEPSEQPTEPTPTPTEPSEQPEPTPTEPSEQPEQPKQEETPVVIPSGNVRLEDGRWIGPENITEGMVVVGVAAFSEGGTTWCVGVKIGSSLSYDDAVKYANGNHGKLPTKEQFEKIYAGKDAVNATLEKLHKLNPDAYPTSKLDGTYWTSTICDGSQTWDVPYKGNPYIFTFEYGQGWPSTDKEGTANALVLREFPSASK